MPRIKRVFTLRLEDPVFDKIEYVAQTEHRSMTNLIEFALIKYLQEYEETHGAIVMPDGESTSGD